MGASLAIVGPESPLAQGVADCLWSIGVKTVGPKKDLAQLETSKAFTRDLLKEYDIPGGPKYQTFDSLNGVFDFLTELGENYVVKFDGLSGGKGVKVSGEHLHSHDEAIAYCQELVNSGVKFVIEEKFGFNKTDLGTYALDTIKSLILSGLIGIPLLLGILYFFEYAGSIAWLYVWVLVIVVSLVMQVIAPIWIMPIFNKFTRLEEGELKQSIMEYAERVGFTYDNVYVIDGSRRSAHSNAFFTGFGKTKRIVLFDTLIEQLNKDEIVSVIAHEVGHNKKGHILLGAALGIVHTGALLFLLSLVLENRLLFDAFFMENTSVYASIMFFGLLFTPVNLVMSPLLQLVSRKHEYQADHWAVETTANRQHLVSGLKKLAAKNLANLSPHRLFVVLNYSHPPLSNRIEAINVTKI